MNSVEKQEQDLLVLFLVLINSSSEIFFFFFCDRIDNGAMYMAIIKWIIINYVNSD